MLSKVALRDRLPGVVKRRLVLALQTGVTLALLYWVFSNPEIRQNTGSVLRQARWDWLLVAVAVAGLETFAGALRWRVFLGVVGIKIGFWDSVRLFYLGLFFNTFLPGSVGGDAVKALALIGRGEPKTAALFSVILDRLSGLIALLITGSVLLVWQWEWLAQSKIVLGLVHGVMLYVAAAAGTLILSLVVAWRGRGERLPRWMPFRTVLTHVCELHFSMVSCWRQSFLALALSIMMLFGYFLVFYSAMRAFDVEAGLLQVFAFMPAVDVLAAMPISLGGVGVREKLFVILLGELFQVPGSTAVWVSLTGFLSTAVWGVAGLLALPIYRVLVLKGRSLAEQQESREPTAG